MKKIWTIVIIIFSITQLQAADEVRGTIITETDTIQATLLIPVRFLTSEINFIKIQNKIKYITANGKKKKLRPSHAIQVTFRYYGENFKLLSRKNYFMRVIVDGYLKLLEYRFSMPNFSPDANVQGMQGTNIERYYYLQKGNGELMRVYGLSFKKDISAYLSDCHEIVQLVENRELRKKDIKDLTKMYNNICKP